jgi:hypothetical protein
MDGTPKTSTGTSRGFWEDMKTSFLLHQAMGLDPKNPEKRRILSDLIEQGNLEAHFQLGVLLEEEPRDPDDRGKAAEHYWYAAQSGEYPGATVRLGAMVLKEKIQHSDLQITLKIYQFLIQHSEVTNDAHKEAH